MNDVWIEKRIQVFPNGKIQVPGCEPTGSTTAPSAAQRMRAHCPCVYVDVNDVLDAIPGAYIDFGYNYGLGYRQKWLVLPAVPQTCCAMSPDYYGIIRSLCTSVVPVTEKWAACDVIGQGFCPSPGFKRPVPREPDPYLPEGQSPYGSVAAIGQWVPPWQPTDQFIPNDNYPEPGP